MLILMFIEIFVFILLTALIYFLNKNKNESDKNIVLISYTVVIFPIVIYFLDKYNIPSRMGINKYVDTKQWLDIIGNYTTALISAVIAAIVLLYTVYIQEKRSNEREKENKRVTNIPLFEYELVDEESKEWVCLTDSNIKDKKLRTQSINLNIKNVGLNTARKLKIEVSSDILNSNIIYEKPNNNILEKGKDITVTFPVMLTPDSYKFNFIIYYKDLLLNSYEQKLVLEYKLYEKDNYINWKVATNLKIENEEYIEKE